MNKTIPILILCAVLSEGCHLHQVQWVTAHYPGGTEFIGVRKRERAPTTYFSVRVESKKGQSLPAACRLILHWRGQDFVVREITPAKLVAAGIEVNRQWGFVGGEDGMNQDYGIEFYFRSNRIQEFYARHSVNSSVQCPFELSVPGGDRFRFPLSEDELKEHFGEPESITAFWGH